MDSSIGIGKRVHEEMEEFVKSMKIHTGLETKKTIAEREKVNVAAKRAECEGRVSGLGRRKKRKK